jgi:CheY-like chemotaxis protein/DNA-binding XRE family transcriptional regulator
MARDSEELKSLDVYVGGKLRKRRQKLDLTLAQVAERLGVSHQQIQKYEQAETRVSAPALYQIATLYGVSPQYFFEGFSDYSLKKNSHVHDHEALNILLVEDDPADELIIRSAIEGMSTKVRIFSVHDGMQAIEFLRNKNVTASFPRPDVILLDLDIPKKNGLSVLRDIKRDRGIHDIPVIMLVNTICQDTLQSVYSHQAAGYICKADSRENLTNRIKSFIQYWTQSVTLPYYRQAA